MKYTLEHNLKMRNAVNELIRAHQEEPKDEFMRIVSAACKMGMIERAPWHTEVERLTKIIEDAGLSAAAPVGSLPEHAGNSEGIQ